jgi:hypothetical protein
MTELYNSRAMGLLEIRERRCMEDLLDGDRNDEPRAG